MSEKYRAFVMIHYPDDEGQSGLLSRLSFFDEWAYMYHDADLLDDGSPKKPHYHALGRFLAAAPRSVASVGRQLGLDDARMHLLQGCSSYKSQLLYFCHYGEDKIQYPPASLVCSDESIRQRLISWMDNGSSGISGSTLPDDYFFECFTDWLFNFRAGSGHVSFQMAYRFCFERNFLSNYRKNYQIVRDLIYEHNNNVSIMTNEVFGNDNDFVTVRLDRSLFEYYNMANNKYILLDAGKENEN